MQSGVGFASIIPNVKGPRKACFDRTVVGEPQFVKCLLGGGIHGTDE